MRGDKQLMLEDKDWDYMRKERYYNTKNNIVEGDYVKSQRNSARR